ncbi:hypothetical protein ACFE04_026252 [Oxalis oulophora]
MHHLPVKTNLVDSVSEFESNQQAPICPKPRRLSPAIPEFLQPLKCNKHSQLPNVEESSGILNMIPEKRVIAGKETLCTGCSPKCYAGSPPGRTSNPLIHDMQFKNQRELVSPLRRTNLSDKFAIASASPT